MVAGVTASGTEIEQTLHGYSEGHGLIAGSMQLDQDSASAMLVMSDLAPRAHTGSDGWLTGYPLPRAGRYVIARTWPAPEMPRPGCVWTHSLVIPQSLIDRSESLRPLIDLLRRPERTFRAYGEALRAPVRSQSAQLPSRLYSLARSTLSELYGANREVSREAADELDAERLIFALWEQQWPRLRRRFRWTTLEAEPSSEVPKFDLVVTGSRGNDTLPVKGASGMAERQGWVVAALADLRTGGGAVRSELRQMGADVHSGRRAFSLLVSAFLLARRPIARPSDAHALIAMMGRRLNADEGKLAKGAILAALLRSPDRLGGDTLDFAISLLPELDDTEAVAIAWATWKLDQSIFWTRLTESETGRRAVSRVLEEMPSAELVQALADGHAPAAELIARRPELLRQPDLWRYSSAVTVEIAKLLDNEPTLLNDALAGAFAIQDVDLAQQLTQGRSTDAMFALYEEWEHSQGRPDTQRDGFARAWLVAASIDKEAARKYLSADFRLRPSIAALARTLGPTEFPPADGGVDVWARSWEDCAGRPVARDREYVAAFFLYRACHFKAKGRGELFSVAFGNLMDYIVSGLDDPGARALVSDHFSQFGMFSLLEQDVTRVYRGIARLVSACDVPIATFVANGRLRHLEGLLDQLQWQPGGKLAVMRAMHELGNRDIAKKRLRLLERAAR